MWPISTDSRSKVPVGGFLLNYLVTGKPVVPASPSPAYAPVDSKSIEENFAGSKRQANLDYLQLLVTKGKLDHVQTLFPALLEVSLISPSMTHF